MQPRNPHRHASHGPDALSLSTELASGVRRTPQTPRGGGLNGSWGAASTPRPPTSPPITRDERTRRLVSRFVSTHTSPSRSPSGGKIRPRKAPHPTSRPPSEVVFRSLPLCAHALTTRLALPHPKSRLLAHLACPGLSSRATNARDSPRLSGIQPAQPLVHSALSRRETVERCSPMGFAQPCTVTRRPKAGLRARRRAFTTEPPTPSPLLTLRAS